MDITAIIGKVDITSDGITAVFPVHRHGKVISQEITMGLAGIQAADVTAALITGRVAKARADITAMPVPGRVRITGDLAVIFPVPVPVEIPAVLTAVAFLADLVFPADPVWDLHRLLSRKLKRFPLRRLLKVRSRSTGKIKKKKIL